MIEDLMNEQSTLTRAVAAIQAVGDRTTALTGGDA